MPIICKLISHSVLLLHENKSGCNESNTKDWLLIQWHIQTGYCVILKFRLYIALIHHKFSPSLLNLHFSLALTQFFCYIFLS